MIIKIFSNKSLIYVKTHTKKRYKKAILNWGNLVVFNMVEMTKKKRTKLKIQNSLWDWKIDL